MGRIADLRLVNHELVDGRQKGLPFDMPPVALERIGQQGWNLLQEHIPLPALVLHQGALDHNSAWMRRFLAQSGTCISPHGKTTMSPHLFERQLDDGAWAITLGTMQQVKAARSTGISRILLANQIVGPKAIEYIVNEVGGDCDFIFYALADSQEGVNALYEVASKVKGERPIQLLVEVGIQGGRTGARTIEGALEVARQVKAREPHLALCGAAGYEGILRGTSDEETEALVREFIDRLADITNICAAENLFAPGPVIISAGGSSFYDLVIERLADRFAFDHEVVIRSGCYLTHDSGAYEKRFDRLASRTHLSESLSQGLQSAIELWAYVQSRPEADRVIANIGRRDVGSDAGLPKPLKSFRPSKPSFPLRLLGSNYETVMLNDQHCYINVPNDSTLQVGDMIAFGVSHPCTTMDKWQIIFIVDRNYNIKSAIRTFF
jgi:D-serine dehydratase